MKPAYSELAQKTEEARIAVIALNVQQGLHVGFICERGDGSKGDRYVEKLGQLLPPIVVERITTNILKEIELIRVRLATPAEIFIQRQKN